MSYSELMDKTTKFDIINFDLDDFNKLVSEVSALDEESKKSDLYTILVKKLKEYFVTIDSENKESLEQTISLMKLSFSQKANEPEDYLDKIFRDNNFDLDNIVQERENRGIEFKEQEENVEQQDTENEKDIDKINKRIKEIESKYLNLTLPSVIKDKLKEILKQANDSLLTEVDESKKDRFTKIIVQANKDIEKLTKEGENLSQNELRESILKNYGMSYDEIVSHLKSKNPEMKDELPSIDKIKEEINKLDEDIQKLDEEIKKDEAKLETLRNETGDSSSTEEGFTEEEEKEMLAIMGELTKRENKYASMSVEELQIEEKRLKNIIDIKKVMVREEQRELQKIEEEFAKREKRYNDMSLDDLREEEKRLKDVINIKKVMVGEEQRELQKIQTILTKRENKYASMSVEELQTEEKRLKDVINIKKVMVGEEQRELSKLEEELNRRRKKDFSNVPKEILKKRLSELKNKKNSPSAKNGKEQEIAEKAQAIKNKKAILENLKKDRKELENLKKDREELDSLKKKISEKPKKPTETKENKKAWLKWATGAAGLAVGFGLAMIVPGGKINFALQALSYARLGTNLVAKPIISTINTWAKDHENNRIAKIINTNREKFNKSPIGQKIAKMREFLNKPEVKWAINGLSIGYIAGNVLEGLGVFDKPETPTLGGEEVVIEDTPPTVIKEITPPKQGDVLDLSKLRVGRESSDAMKLVGLDTDVAKEVIFDKIKVLPDGTEMWHFKQMNDLGYAWFSKDEVMSVLGEQAKAIAETASRTL